MKDNTPVAFVISFAIAVAFCLGALVAIVIAPRSVLKEVRVPYACVSTQREDWFACSERTGKCVPTVKEKCLQWKKCEGFMDCYGEKY